MLLYYSGTGNTRYVAETLSKQLDEPLYSVTSSDPASLSFSGKSLGFLFPIYSWGVPPIVLDFIHHLNDRFIKDIKGLDVWMCCTCGDETGKAPEMFIKALRKKGIIAKGAWSVIMPNNYVLLSGFDIDPIDVQRRKLDAVLPRLNEIADKIRSGIMERDVVTGSFPALRSAVYPLFVRFGINPDKWTASDACISCAKCVEVCPADNIRIEKGRPVWDANCLSCCACYHYCPSHAIRYGKATRGKGQYFFKPSNLSDV